MKLAFGADHESSLQLAGREGRAGVISSGLFLVLVGCVMLWVSSVNLILELVLLSFGVLLIAISSRPKLTRSRANALAFAGHVCALFSFYIFFTRMVNVGYVTDSIVGTYLGVVKVIQLQNPYGYSIKALLDQFGFPPSFYTPKVDGTFEFHLNYPAMNFLVLIPFYLAGLRDLRDGVFIFHLASILLVFSLVPSKWKALSLVPFSFGFPLAIGYSWTDSVWAFFLLMTAALWRRHRMASLLSFGLAAATKQIALVAVPFLLIRMWKDAKVPRKKNALKGTLWILAGFLGPNLPFIIASPLAWWTATAGPYLPNNAPLIPGGIGLSEILPDIGLVLSPSYFTILAAIAMAGAIAIFIARYHRLNGALWAMPALVVFFYGRSLPNYIVYWGFPFFYELFKYGNPRLSMINSALARAIRAPRLSLLAVLRGRVGPALLLVLILISVLVGAWGAYVAQASVPRLDVRVGGITDPDALGVATKLNMALINHGSSGITPKFFVKWFFLWNLWLPNSSDSLASGVGRNYELTATDALAGVPPGYSFRVAVYDSVSGEFLGESRLYTSQVARPSVANPRFAWWALDTRTGRQVPFPWRLSLRGVDGGQAGIAVGDTNSSSGAQLWLNSTTIPVAIREVALSQRVLFNESSFQVQVYLGPSIVAVDSAAFGLEASGGGHILDFLFSPTASQETVSSVGSTATVVIPVSSVAWQTVLVDVQTNWTGLGWSSSPDLSVSFFLRSSAIGSFTAAIGGIGPVQTVAVH